MLEEQRFIACACSILCVCMHSCMHVDVKVRIRISYHISFENSIISRSKKLNDGKNSSGQLFSHSLNCSPSLNAEVVWKKRRIYTQQPSDYKHNETQHRPSLFRLAPWPSDTYWLTEWVTGRHGRLPVSRQVYKVVKRLTAPALHPSTTCPPTMLLWSRRGQGRGGRGEVGVWRRTWEV